MNGQVSNLANISRDAAIPRATISTYFEILVDTLLRFWLPAFKPKAKIKEVTHKFIPAELEKHASYYPFYSFAKRLLAKLEISEQNIIYNAATSYFM